MNRRERMRASNKMVREWLLANNFDQIWFKPHGKRKDIVFTQKGSYRTTDLWNLFDGIVVAPYGTITFIQIKTNSWAKESDIQEWRKTVNYQEVLVFNVTNKLKECNGKYKVLFRKYDWIV